MLYEISNPRQIAGEGRRRWFADEYFDLIIWYDEADTLAGFQLCYDRTRSERALTWRRDRGYSHERVDDGEIPGRTKMSPVLVPDGAFPRSAVADRFFEASARIDPEIRELVCDRLLRFPL